MTIHDLTDEEIRDTLEIARKSENNLVQNQMKRLVEVVGLAHPDEVEQAHKRRKEVEEERIRSHKEGLAEKELYYYYLKKVEYNSNKNDINSDYYSYIEPIVSSLWDSD